MSLVPVITTGGAIHHMCVGHIGHIGQSSVPMSPLIALKLSELGTWFLISKPRMFCRVILSKIYQVIMKDKIIMSESVSC